MSIEIKLDTAALASLIESDPNFKVQVQSAVLSNIAKRYIKDALVSGDASVQRAINTVALEATKESLGKYGTFDRYEFKINPTAYESFRKSAEQAVRNGVVTTINEAVTKAVEDKMLGLKDRIIRLIDKQVDVVVESVIRERINEAIKALVAK